MELRQGKTAYLSWSGTAYKRYQQISFLWTSMECSDHPYGWRTSLTVRVPDTPRP